MKDLKSQNQDLPQYDETHYAVVDLGSNSFHLLITQLVNTPHVKSIITVDKVKEKVRLASGLDENNFLTADAFNRGINCLKNFGQYLKTIPVQNICIVATAALRIAKNNQLFFEAANAVLPKDIRLLSGIEEASTIYFGASHNIDDKQAVTNSNQLVIDIGGASTEIILGTGCQAKEVVSLNIGCVSFNKQYFSGGLLTAENFEKCIANATISINTVKDNFIALGWQSAMSSSGTMQALVEILNARQQPAVISLTYLNEIKAILIASKHIDNIDISGLRVDRKAVLASGLGILIALFECLKIESLSLSCGALREGLLYTLLPEAKIVS